MKRTNTKQPKRKSNSKRRVSKQSKRKTTKRRKTKRKTSIKQRGGMKGLVDKALDAKSSLKSAEKEWKQVKNSKGYYSSSERESYYKNYLNALKKKKEAKQKVKNAGLLTEYSKGKRLWKRNKWL